MPAVPRHFWIAILIQIGVEWNGRVIEKIALDPDPRGVARRLLAETAGSSDAELWLAASVTARRPVDYVKR
ncbi:MAG TPA: hypothetical protein VGO18_03670, partial [Steroidobacteraceae bacterium]|nr:hypothetical protein [Steroidobacteraceae bacterium]